VAAAAGASGLPGDPLSARAATDWAQVIRTRLAGSEPHHAIEDWRVPGLSAADSQKFRRYFPSEPRPAAVLVPLVQRAELTVLLTQRATQLRNHAGQISFPGGRIEPHDAGPREAALREAHEEIGLEERFVSVVGYLPDHIVMTGFRVTPVVAFVSPGFELLLDAEEVANTFEVPVGFVFDPANHRLQVRRSGFTGEEVEFCDIPYGEHNIWGATAGMLLTLWRLCVGADSQ
jgi:8-oxo-dGTP pyrophosphatase MutT (NUDIX family)